jgi:hypothetical protein
MEWICKDLEGNGGSVIEVPSLKLPGRTEENHKNSVMIAGDPDEIQTEDLPNSSLAHYRYVNPLGVVVGDHDIHGDSSKNYVDLRYMIHLQFA